MASSSKKKIGELRLEFDWSEFEKIGKEFLDAVVQYGEDTAKEVLDHQKEMIQVARRMKAGQLKEQTARRILHRHRNSIEAYFRGLEQFTHWKAYAAYQHALDNLFSMVALLLSSVIKVL